MYRIAKNKNTAFGGGFYEVEYDKLRVLRWAGRVVHAPPEPRDALLGVVRVEALLLLPPGRRRKLRELDRYTTTLLQKLEQCCLVALLLVVAEQVLLFDHGAHDMRTDEQPKDGHHQHVQHREQSSDDGDRV